MINAKRLVFGLFVCIQFLGILTAQAAVLAEPTIDLLYDLKQSMVKIGTTTKTGGHGFGTGVAVTKDHVVTNCHVLGNANGISISKWGTEYPAESIQADWKHDLCILKEIGRAHV